MEEGATQMHVSGCQSFVNFMAFLVLFSDQLCFVPFQSSAFLTFIAAGQLDCWTSSFTFFVSNKNFLVGASLRHVQIDTKDSPFFEPATNVVLKLHNLVL